MKRPPRISDAEWQVMEVLWTRNPLAANDVIEALAKSVTWTGNTVRTLLTRLVGKGVLTTEKEGVRFLYRPKLDREHYVEAESETFLKRVFFGSAKPLLLHFAQNSKLSKEDIAELKRCLEQEGKSK